MGILLLGPVEVRDGLGREVDAGHSRQRAVLAALALSPNQVTMLDDLIDHVWGDDPPATARSIAYTYVSRLRRALATAEHADGGEPRIRSRSGGYLLAIDPDHVDLHRFRKLVTRSREAGHDNETAIGLLREALGLWRGGALSGIEGPWAARVRGLLDLERTSALIECHELQLKLGRHAAILDELVALADADPLNERILRNLITALYRSGRQAEALERYERLRRGLTERLGVDPAPETRLLYARVLRSDPALAAAPGTARAAAAPTPPRQIPRGCALVGRAGELRQLDDALLSADLAGDPADPAPPGGTLGVCSIEGPAGVGKTALATHWARTRARHFPDGQIFLDLHGAAEGTAEPALSPLAVLRHVLWSLGVPAWQIPDDPDACAELCRGMLRRMRVLIVLDDADSAEQIAPLICPASHSALIVTSRQGPASPDGGLPGPRIQLSLLTAGQSASMLTAILGRERTEAEPYALARIVELCGHLPLALVTAAEQAVARPRLALEDVASSLAVRTRTAARNEGFGHFPRPLPWARPVRRDPARPGAVPRRDGERDGLRPGL